ncbi:hypothetical protein DOM22_01575 [Bdellovibrio sp. ZAP7]|uniref:hypothetical protein n=1 Tax=Bdellovibrio sp. ZAP7 TaxID=2231053 RepID=UPI00115B528E|nr:hypothetical protein [Bdellovibrio sp. ZAP7]QDK43944.1 hypothetical protein DOM22_01575 [Bdellovibrio sp. ZAP7]
MKTITRSLKALVFLCVLLNSGLALAEGMGKLGLLYMSSSSEDSGAESKSTRTLYDVALYYKFQGSPWVLGGLYQNDAQASDSTTVNRTSYGVSGGYMTRKESGGYLLATYFVSSTYGDYKEGSGFQIDFGYKVPTKIPLAFQLSYKSYDYSKYNHKDTKLDPYFVVIADF